MTKSELSTTVPKENGEYRDERGKFLPGNPGGPGRPQGSISPITKIRQIFEENPDQFEEFVKAYIEDPSNRKHLVEMLDGKPQQDVTSKGERLIPVPIMTLDVSSNESDEENSGTE